MAFKGQPQAIAFDEFGRPFIILKEQEQQRRLTGLDAHKVACWRFDLVMDFLWYLADILLLILCSSRISSLVGLLQIFFELPLDLKVRLSKSGVNCMFCQFCAVETWF